jgi:hypothetical protein
VRLGRPSTASVGVLAASLRSRSLARTGSAQRHVRTITAPSKADNSIFDFVYSPFSGWRTTYLPGQVTADPEVAIFGVDKNLHVAARGTDGYRYHWWTTGSGGWTNPVRVDTISVVGIPTMIGKFHLFHIVARAADNSVWAWSYSSKSGTWSRAQLPGSTADSPDSTVDPRSRLVNVVVRGTDNKIYR